MLDASPSIALSSPHPTDDTPQKSARMRAFDAMVMALTALVARAFGYTFRVGTDRALERDAHALHEAVWAQKGVRPPEDVAWYAERYDRATMWIVAYHRGRPAGVMGLLDMRIASVALDYSRCLAPQGLPLDRTREIARLAIVSEHRGGPIMIGLLFEMLAWSRAHGIDHLFSGSTPALFRVYRRYNPTARLVEAPADPAENPVRDRYFAPLRAYGREGVLYTFDVAGGAPGNVAMRWLTGRLAEG